MSLKVHQMGLSLGAILHQDSSAKIQTKRYLSKYQKEGLVLAKEQGGSSSCQQSITSHVAMQQAKQHDPTHSCSPPNWAEH